VDHHLDNRGNQERGGRISVPELRRKDAASASSWLEADARQKGAFVVRDVFHGLPG
jgi:hypothetical protein